MSATAMQVRQWSEEVAADPASLAFLPLAEAYRAQGRRDAALRLCIRGLERHPTHVEAHYLLGLLYHEGGEVLKAFDEWDIALRLSPEHAGARREIGLISVERGEWAAAVRHLERAVADGSPDPAVHEALALARSRTATAEDAPAPPPAAPQKSAAAAPAGANPISPAPPAPAPSAPVAEWDAGREWEVLREGFRGLAAERGVVGAVLLDAQGYVVAGELQVGGTDRAAEIAATLAGASSEAERAIRHLGLGEWRGILLETPSATVRLAPASDGGMLVVAAGREVPTGWVLRVAARARDAAERFLMRGGW